MGISGTAFRKILNLRTRCPLFHRNLHRCSFLGRHRFEYQEQLCFLLDSYRFLPILKVFTSSLCKVFSLFRNHKFSRIHFLPTDFQALLYLCVYIFNLFNFNLLPTFIIYLIRIVIVHRILCLTIYKYININAMSYIYFLLLNLYDIVYCSTTPLIRVQYG